MRYPCLATVSCILLVLAAASGAASARDFHVAPGGDDAAAGTAEAPFATPARAQRAVRAFRAAHPDEDVTVVLHAGTYTLSAPLVFGPEDGGSDRGRVTWRAADGEDEAVTLSGGTPVTGWASDEAGVWGTKVPGAEGGKWHPRHLWVGGKRAVRARWPNADAEVPYVEIAGGGLAEDLKDFTLRFRPDTVRAWAGLEDVECVVLKLWSSLRKRVAAVDPKGRDGHPAAAARPGEPQQLRPQGHVGVLRELAGLP